jgi:hypothetical protein
VTADDIVTILPYLLVQAKVPRLFAHANYIEAFHYSMSDGEQIEVFRTNLLIAMERLKIFPLTDSGAEEQESGETQKLEGEDEFELSIKLDPSE